MRTCKVKVIELEDYYTDRAGDYPYIHSIKSCIRFQLRSKIAFDHEPLLLIEKLDAFDYLLPLRAEIDTASPETA